MPCVCVTGCNECVRCTEHPACATEIRHADGEFVLWAGVYILSAANCELHNVLDLLFVPPAHLILRLISATGLYWYPISQGNILQVIASTRARRLQALTPHLRILALASCPRGPQMQWKTGGGCPAAAMSGADYTHTSSRLRPGCSCGIA